MSGKTTPYAVNDVVERGTAVGETWTAEETLNGSHEEEAEEGGHLCADDGYDEKDERRDCVDGIATDPGNFAERRP